MLDDVYMQVVKECDELEIKEDSRISNKRSGTYKPCSIETRRRIELFSELRDLGLTLEDYIEQQRKP